MNAAVIHAFTAPPSYTIFADPIAQPGEHLVTVTAAALHPIVKLLAAGTHYGSTGELPFIPGVDGAGILQTPANDLPAGTRVYFGISRPPFGTFADLALAASYLLVPLPDALPNATAAAIANPAMSSWVALNRGSFLPGETVLILGATGVAGHLAIQIAKRRGAKRVIAAGRNPESLQQALTLGADAIISLELEPAALLEAFRSEFASGIDLILDYLWGPPAEAVLQAIAKKGLKTSSNRVRYVQIGNSAGPNITLPAQTLRSSGLELLGSGFGSASLEQILLAVADFFTLAVAHPFTFNLKTAPLSDIESLWSTKEEATRLVFIP
jgi:NADPH:quinone reductase-like Zn-dependent oxidoreductase